MKFEVFNAGEDDVSLLVRHRLAMWSEIHSELESNVKMTEKLTRDWIKRRLVPSVRTKDKVVP